MRPSTNRPARGGEGIRELLAAVYDVATGAVRCTPYRVESVAGPLRDAVDALAARVKEEFPGLPNARWVALRLLEGDQRMIDAVRTGELGNLTRTTEPGRTAQATPAAVDGPAGVRRPNG